MAFASSTFVVLIFSVIGTHTFDGYGMLISAVGDTSITGFVSSGYAQGVNPRPARVHVVRRAVISFDQVSHIRDNSGLQGKPVSSAKDGNMLGLAAGRTLCRSIDKRAFKDDPIHYSDVKYVSRLVPDTQPVSLISSTKDEERFMSMDYAEYVSWYKNSRNDSEPAPTIQNIVLPF